MSYTHISVYSRVQFETLLTIIWSRVIAVVKDLFVCLLSITVTWPDTVPVLCVQQIFTHTS